MESKKNNILKTIILTGVILILLYIFYFDIIKNVNKEIEISGFKIAGTFVTIEPGDEVSYKLTNKKCKFDEIDLMLTYYNNLNLNIELINELTNEQCYNKDITNDYTRIKEDAVKNTGISAPIIFLNIEKVLPKSDYLIKIKNIGPEVVALSTINDSELNTSILLHSNLGIKIGILFLIIIAIYIFVILKLVNYEKIEFHSFFLLSVIPLGIIYFIIYVPWSIPDTESHYAAMYRFSNIALGYSSKEDEWKCRKDEKDLIQNIWITNRNPGIESYEVLIHNYSVFTNQTEMENRPFVVERMKYYSFVNYWPQILGLVLGRLLHLSAISTIYLAKLFILIVYIISCYRAIKRAPMGKSIFLLVSLLPVSLMLSSGLTYDVMVIITTLNLISSILVLYKEESTKKDLIEASFWAFMVGAVKGGGFLLLLPLVFVLFDSIKNKKSMKKILCVLGSGIFSVLLFDVILQWDNHLYQFGIEGNGKMSASFAFRHPIEYFKLCINTYFLYADGLSFALIGSKLGLVEEVIPHIIVVILVLPMLLLASLEKDSIELKKKDIWIMAFIILLAVIFTPMMLLSWTNEGADVIDGVQGRYYLPILPLLLIIITKYLMKYVNIDDNNFLKYKARCLKLFGIMSCICIYFIERLCLLR